MPRTLMLGLVALGLAACGGGGGDNDGQNVDASCSSSGQKQFVLDNMRYWYLWNDQLPASVNLDAYATPEALLAYLATFSPDLGTGGPVDRFSFINSADADAAFFGEGKFEGYGFGSTFLAADDWRLTRVFAGSPAAAAGFARGQRIIALNGRSIADIQAAEGVDAVLADSPVAFTMRRLDDSEFTVSVAVDIVTIDPVPQVTVFPLTGTPGVGYIELATFISTADAELDAAFTQFRNAGITDLIIDLRYNGGGLVSTAERLGDYLGGAVAQNLVFSETRFNADRAGEYNNADFFTLLANSLNLSRLYIIASDGTASASELVTNSLDPFVDVFIIGDDTFGKPVGQVGLEFCDKILRPTAFQTVNAVGFGDYFDGLPVDCPAADDLTVPVGDPADPNVAAALFHAENNACPVALLAPAVSKPQIEPAARDAMPRLTTPARVYANAR